MQIQLRMNDIKSAPQATAVPLQMEAKFKN